MEIIVQHHPFTKGRHCRPAQIISHLLSCGALLGTEKAVGEVPGRRQAGEDCHRVVIGFLTDLLRYCEISSIRGWKWIVGTEEGDGWGRYCSRLEWEDWAIDFGVYGETRVFITDKDLYRQSNNLRVVREMNHAGVLKWAYWEGSEERFPATARNTPTLHVP